MSKYNSVSIQFRARKSQKLPIRQQKSTFEYADIGVLIDLIDENCLVTVDPMCRLRMFSQHRPMDHRERSVNRNQYSQMHN